MKKVAIIKSLIVIMSLIFVSCSSDEDDIWQDNSEVEETMVNLTYSNIENEIFNLVNNHRDSLGLSTLTLNNAISVVSITHTNYMINQGVASHDNFGQRHADLVKKEHAKEVGENVAYGYSSAGSVFQAWLKSEGHRANIEKEGWTNFGISVKKDSNERYYFTTLFIYK